MIKVFIGGSRKLGRLNNLLRDRLDNIVRQQHTVLIGDANGIDKAVQNYLSEKNYNNVIVYHVGNRYRNNVGHWQTKKTEEPGKTKNFRYYATKDMEMVKDTNFGLMIWDLESKGTLNNIINLLKINKVAVVYISKTKKFYNLNSLTDLGKLLGQLGNGKLNQLSKELDLNLENWDKQKEFNFT